MSKVRLVLSAVAVVMLSGCYHAMVDTGRPTNGQEIRKAWASSFLYGLVPPATVETAQKCPGGVARVETQQSFLNMLANAITGGLYTPMEIRVQCTGATAMGAAEVVPADATMEEKQSAIVAAAQRSVREERAVAVAFIR